MKKFFLAAIIIAISVSFLLIPSANISFAQEETEEEGYELDNGYLAEIVYGNFNMKYGNIVRTFTITLDKSFYNELSEEGVVTKQDLTDFLTNYITAIGFEAESDEMGRFIGKKEYDSVTDMYIEYGMDGYEKNNSEYDSQSSFFFTETTNRQTTIFEDINSVGGFMNELKQVLNMYGIDDEEISLSYHYGTPYKIISTDAEKSYYDTNSNIYVHEFYMTLGESGREIIMKQTSPNTQNWYLLAIVLGVPVVLAALIGLAANKLKQRRRA